MMMVILVQPRQQAVVGFRRWTRMPCSLDI